MRGTLFARRRARGPAALRAQDGGDDELGDEGEHDGRAFGP